MKKILILIFSLFFSISIFADINSAMDAYNSGNYAQAYNEFLPLAKRENSEAQNNLGNLYALGLGIKKNYKQAVYWYQKAFENGSKSAVNNLAGMYYYGLGVKKNTAKGIKLFKQAINDNEPAAFNSLGYIYIYGKDIKKDVKKGVLLITEAAQNSNVIAQCNLGLIYYEGDYGLKKDYNKAVDWTKMAAYANYSKAQYALARIYFEGKAVKQDLRQSYFWAYISMKNGYQPAEKTVKILSDKLTLKEISEENKKAEAWLYKQPKKSFVNQIQNFTLQ